MSDPFLASPLSLDDLLAMLGTNDPGSPRPKALSPTAPGASRANAIALPALVATARRDPSLGPLAFLGRALHFGPQQQRSSGLPADAFELGANIDRAVTAQEHSAPAVSTFAPEAAGDATGFVRRTEPRAPDVVGPFQGSDEDFQRGTRSFDRALERRSDFLRQSPEMRALDRFDHGVVSGMFLGRQNQVLGAMDPSATSADYDARDAALPRPTDGEAVLGTLGSLVGQALPFAGAGALARGIGGGLRAIAPFAEAAPEATQIGATGAGGRIAAGATELGGLHLASRGATQDPDVLASVKNAALMGAGFAAASGFVDAAGAHAPEHASDPDLTHALAAAPANVHVDIRNIRDLVQSGGQDAAGAYVAALAPSARTAVAKALQAAADRGGVGERAVRGGAGAVIGAGIGAGADTNDRTRGAIGGAVAVAGLAAGALAPEIRAGIESMGRDALPPRLADAGAFNPRGTGLERFSDGELSTLAREYDGSPAQAPILAEIRARDEANARHRAAADAALEDASTQGHALTSRAGELPDGYTLRQDGVYMTVRGPDGALVTANQVPQQAVRDALIRIGRDRLKSAGALGTLPQVIDAAPLPGQASGRQWADYLSGEWSRLRAEGHPSVADGSPESADWHGLHDYLAGLNDTTFAKSHVRTALEGLPPLGMEPRPGESLLDRIAESIRRHTGNEAGVFDPNGRGLQRIKDDAELRRMVRVAEGSPAQGAIIEELASRPGGLTGLGEDELQRLAQVHANTPAGDAIARHAEGFRQQENAAEGMMREVSGATPADIDALQQHRALHADNLRAMANGLPLSAPESEEAFHQMLDRTLDLARTAPPGARQQIASELVRLAQHASRFPSADQIAFGDFYGRLASRFDPELKSGFFGGATEEDPAGPRLRYAYSRLAAPLDSTATLTDAESHQLAALRSAHRLNLDAATGENTERVENGTIGGRYQPPVVRPPTEEAVQHSLDALDAVSPTVRAVFAGDLRRIAQASPTHAQVYNALADYYEGSGTREDVLNALRQGSPDDTAVSEAGLRARAEAARRALGYTDLASQPASPRVGPRDPGATMIRGAAGVGIGAGYGAATNRRDPVRGAISGGLAGLGFGLVPDAADSIARIAGNDVGGIGDLTSRARMLARDVPRVWRETPAEANAYSLGESAAKNGLARDVNPFDDGTRESTAFVRGWGTVQKSSHGFVDPRVPTAIAGAGAGAAGGAAAAGPGHRTEGAIGGAVLGGLGGALGPRTARSMLRYAADEAGAVGGRSAAVRLRDGQVVAGLNHGDAVNNAVEAGLLPPDMLDVPDSEWHRHFTPGFQTPDGFVPRLGRDEVREADTLAARPAEQRYVAQPTRGGAWRVVNLTTGHVAEDGLRGVGSEGTAAAIARRLNQGGGSGPGLVPDVLSSIRRIAGDQVGGAGDLSRARVRLNPDGSVLVNGERFDSMAAAKAEFARRAQPQPVGPRVPVEVRDGGTIVRTSSWPPEAYIEPRPDGTAVLRLNPSVLQNENSLRRLSDAFHVEGGQPGQALSSAEAALVRWDGSSGSIVKRGRATTTFVAPVEFVGADDAIPPDAASASAEPAVPREPPTRPPDPAARGVTRNADGTVSVDGRKFPSMQAYRESQAPTSRPNDTPPPADAAATATAAPSLDDAERALSQALGDSRPSRDDLASLASGDLPAADFAAKYGVPPRVAEGYARAAQSFEADPDGYVSPLDDEAVAAAAPRARLEHGDALPPSPPVDSTPDDGFIPPDKGPGRGRIGVRLFSPEGLAQANRLTFLSTLTGRVRHAEANTLAAVADLASKVPRGSMDWALSKMTGVRTADLGLVAEAKAAASGFAQGIGKVADAARGRAPLMKSGQLEDVPQTVFRNPVLRAWQTAVQGVVSAVDVPFYESAFQKSITEQARVQAINEISRGDLTAADRKARIADLTANPTEQMQAMAVLAAQEHTFQNASFLGGLASGMKEGAAKAVGSMTRARGKAAGAPGVDAAAAGSERIARAATNVLLPFTRTAGAVAGRAVEHTPLGILGNVKDAFDLYKAASGANVDPNAVAIIQHRLATRFGRWTVGLPVMAVGKALYGDGLMTGAQPTAEQKDEGAVPFSVKVGGTWHRISPLSPMSVLLATGAEYARSGLAAAGKSALSQVRDESVLRSTDDVSKALKPDGSLADFGTQFVTSRVPGIVRQAADFVDQRPREPEGFRQQVESEIPFLSRSVPGKVGEFGGEMRDERPALVRAASVFLDPTATRSTGVAESGSDPQLHEALQEVGVHVSRLQRIKAETSDQFNARIAANPDGPPEQRDNEPDAAYRARVSAWNQPREAETDEHYRARQQELGRWIRVGLQQVVGAQEPDPSSPVHDAWQKYHDAEDDVRDEFPNESPDRRTGLVRARRQAAVKSAIRAVQKTYAEQGGEDPDSYFQQ